VGIGHPQGATLGQSSEEAEIDPGGQTRAGERSKGTQGLTSGRWHGLGPAPYR
jgi:hypothetical protein